MDCTRCGTNLDRATELSVLVATAKPAPLVSVYCPACGASLQRVAARDESFQNAAEVLYKLGYDAGYAAALEAALLKIQAIPASD